MPPLRRTPFPQSTRSQVWLTIVGWLKSDPVLHQAVDTWQVWDNSDESTMAPTEENLPLFRMTPSGGTQQWADENTQNCTWNLKIEIGVEGNDLPSLLDFWGAIEASLFTGNTLLNELQSMQVIQKTITMPSVVPKRFGGKTGLAGEGVLQIKMRISS